MKDILNRLKERADAGFCTSQPKKRYLLFIFLVSNNTGHNRSLFSDEPASMCYRSLDCDPNLKKITKGMIDVECVPRVR